MENQEEVWDAIAKPWNEFRLKPIGEVADFLKNKTGRILDFGCGNGKHFPCMNGEIYGIDISENMLEFAKKLAERNNLKADLTKTSADELPFDDNFFDSAICVAVIHCIPEKEKREKALKELFRVLKPNAEAWISVWDKNQKAFENFEKESLIPWKYDGKTYQRYYYLYEKEEFLDLLKKAGFEIVSVADSENPSGFYSKRNIDVIVRKVYK